ncbi:yippee-like protein [Entophlyctis helioformis]|nr:yippee-like protein [Entophlyctis helioformis]
MGCIFRQFLDGNSERVFACTTCKTHLSTHEAIISKAFQGQHGKAFLFNQVVNIYEGKPENRHMTTGLHTVRDIYCTYCQTVVGWKYDKAFEETQKYKEGRFILERQLITEL